MKSVILKLEIEYGRLEEFWILDSWMKFDNKYLQGESIYILLCLIDNTINKYI